MKNPDESVLDTISVCSDLKRIRTSEKVETIYKPIGIGREVVYSSLLILESQHLFFALLHRYQMGLYREKHVSASLVGH